jgi:superfamily II helicase
MEDRVFISVNTSTKNEPSPFENFDSMVANYTVANIAVVCAVCAEETPMNSNDYRYRAQGIFICDKCKAAILHVRKLLEDRGSVA